MSAIDDDTIVKYLSEIVRCEAINMNVGTSNSVFTYGLILHFSFYFSGLKFAHSSKFFRNSFSLQRGTVLNIIMLFQIKVRIFILIDLIQCINVMASIFI